MKDNCCIKKCDRPIYAKRHKLCLAHYARFMRYGTVGDAPIRKRRVLPTFDPTLERTHVRK
jgi:hypothetical protein